MTMPQVAVVGGSLGGLTTALLLRDAGCDVDVFERSESKLSGFGAGIVVHEATMRYFRRRGGLQSDRLEVPATFFRYLHGHALTSFEQDGAGVAAHFANGSVVRADLLVCADGILSTARSQLAPH